MGLVCLATGGWIVLYMISATWSPAQSLPSQVQWLLNNCLVVLSRQSWFWTSQ